MPVQCPFKTIVSDEPRQVQACRDNWLRSLTPHHHTHTHTQHYLPLFFVIQKASMTHSCCNMTAIGMKKKEAKILQLNFCVFHNVESQKQKCKSTAQQYNHNVARISVALCQWRDMATELKARLRVMTTTCGLRSLDERASFVVGITHYAVQHHSSYATAFAQWQDMPRLAISNTSMD